VYIPDAYFRKGVLEGRVGDGEGAEGEGGAWGEEVEAEHGEDGELTQGEASRVAAMVKQIEAETGARIQVAETVEIGVLLRGKGLSAIAPCSPPDNAELLGQLGKDNKEKVPGGHAFRRLALAGSAAARQRAKAALLRRCLTLRPPARMAPDEWQEMLRWRAWYFGHEGVVQWHSLYNRYDVFLASLPPASPFHQPLPATPVDSELVSDVLADLERNMAKCGEQGTMVGCSLR